jgi:hypothetical protein
MPTPHEIDHVFVLTDPGAPAADTLAAAGFAEGPSRIHPGQGTTNRRFFVENAMVEFLWVHDPDEAGSETVRPTRLLDRWRRRDEDGSPFGICVRPVAEGVDDPPFPAWDYRPPYLPAGRTIRMADSASTLDEPLLFCLPWGRAPADPPGVRSLTGVVLESPVVEPSVALRAVEGLIDTVRSDTHGLTLTFDDGARGETVDLRPDAPLVVRY